MLLVAAILFSVLHRRTVKLGWFLAGGAWAMMTYQELANFVGPPLFALPIAPPSHILIATAAMTALVVALLLRRLGWQVARPSVKQDVDGSH